MYARSAEHCSAFLRSAVSLRFRRPLVGATGACPRLTALLRAEQDRGAYGTVEFSSVYDYNANESCFDVTRGTRNRPLSHVKKGKHSANRSDIIMAICASALGRWMDWTPNGG